MREFQDKNKVKKRLYSKTVLLGLLIAIVLLTRGVYGVYAKEQESRAEVNRIKAKKVELEARFAEIKQNEEMLKTPEGIEAEIRSKFDVAKDGEGVIVVVEKDVPIIEEDRRGILKKFWDGVVGVFRRGTSTANVTNSAESGR